jgi:hypothetical protein
MSNLKLIALVAALLASGMIGTSNAASDTKSFLANTAISSLGKLLDASEQLAKYQGTSPTVNAVRDYIAVNIGGDNALAEALLGYQAALLPFTADFADELAGCYGCSTEETRGYARLALPTEDPLQRRKAMRGDAQNLLRDLQWYQGTLLPENQAVLDKILGAGWRGKYEGITHAVWPTAPAAGFGSNENVESPAISAGLDKKGLEHHARHHRASVQAQGFPREKERRTDPVG